jgi:maltose alpha-D-glucosyltransferase/alpha-amylase
MGMKGMKHDPDIRRPMQWSGQSNAGFSSATPWHNLNSNYPSVNIEAQQADSTSLWHWYRWLIQQRTAHPALSRGTIQMLNCSNINLLSILRQSAEEALLVLHNFASATQAHIQATTTDLAPGSYQLQDLACGQNAGTLHIDQDGKIAEELLLPRIETRETKLYKLQKIRMEE